MIEHHNARIMRTPHQTRDGFCVYVHRLAPNPEPFYIGACKFDQVFKYPDAQANNKWAEIVTPDTVLDIEIVASATTLTEAHTEQIRLVRLHRPQCNITGYRLSGRLIITCIEGPNAGKTYNSVSEAAIRNGVAQPTMSNHLNGVAGYETIRGMKFKRGI